MMVFEDELEALEVEVEAQRPVYGDPELQEAYEIGFEAGREQGFREDLQAELDKRG